MTTSDVRQVFERLATSGVRTITLLGGEATLRHDFQEIVEAGSSLGINLSINTNLVASQRLMTALDLPAINNVVVSLDGLDVPTHDSIRGKGMFDRTMSNLSQLMRHHRVASGDVTVDFTFVLTDKNKHQVTELPAFYHRHGFNRVNFKTLQYNDRSETNKDALRVEQGALLDSVAAFYVSCLIDGDIKIDLHIPPAFGEYLNQLILTPEKLWNYVGCGGVNVYTYVDYYGNNIPCPAMSKEENGRSKLTGPSDRLSLVHNDVQSIRERSLFKGFERTVQSKSRNRLMDPCSSCKYNQVCSPCTNEVIRGKDRGTIDLCMAVKERGDERVPGIAARIFDLGADDVMSSSTPPAMGPTSAIFS